MSLDRLPFGWAFSPYPCQEILGMVGMVGMALVRAQLRVLRALTWVLYNTSVIVRLIWVPSELHASHPMRRVAADFQGSVHHAKMEAWERWKVLQSHPDLCWVQGLSYV